MGTTGRRGQLNETLNSSLLPSIIVLSSTRLSASTVYKVTDLTVCQGSPHMTKKDLSLWPVRAASGRELEPPWRPGGHRKPQQAQRSTRLKSTLSHLSTAWGGPSQGVSLGARSQRN